MGTYVRIATGGKSDPSGRRCFFGSGRGCRRDPRVLSRPMTERLAAAVTGPRGRWLTVAVWIALGLAGFLARAHIDEVTAAGQSSYLPSHAESTRVVDLLQSDFKGGDD